MKRKIYDNLARWKLKASGNELFFYSNYDKEEAENRMQIKTKGL
jgi:hypothetical protein